MGNSKSISEAYGEWQDDNGDIGQLREYIAAHKGQIEEKLFTVR